MSAKVHAVGAEDVPDIKVLGGGPDARDPGAAAELVFLPRPASLIFDSISPATEIGSPYKPHGACEIHFALQLLSPRALAGRLAPILCTILLASVISFAWTSLFFGAIVHGPPEAERPPAGYQDWTSCGASSETALGRRYPVRLARLVISMPKFVGSSLLALLGGYWINGKFTRWVTAQCFMHAATIATAVVVLFAAGTRMTYLDPLTCIAQLAIFCAMNFSAPSLDESGRATAFRKVIYFFVMLVILSFNTVLVNVMAYMFDHDIPPGTVAFVSAIIVSLMDTASRWSFKFGAVVAEWICTAAVFMYLCTMYFAIRKFLLTYTDAGDVVVASATAAGMEMLSHICGTVYVVFEYNRCVRKGRQEDGVRFLNLFLTAAISDSVAEHIALHGSLGLALFIDTRIFTFPVNEDRALSLQSWAIQFGFELLSDMFTLTLLFGLLPVRIVLDGRARWKSATLVVFGVAVVLWAPLSTLQAYTKWEHFDCGGY